MNRSAKRLLIEATNVDGFSLANRREFGKFAKLFTHQTFSLYSMPITKFSNFISFLCVVPLYDDVHESFF